MVPCRALVDTGSTYCVFNKFVADDLEIDLKGGERREIKGLRGKVMIPLRDVTIEMNDEALPCKVGFMPEDKPEYRLPFCGVLGHYKFLNRFQVRMEKEYVELEMMPS